MARFTSILIGGAVRGGEPGPEPEDPNANIVHVVGDIHFGQIMPERLALIEDDFAAIMDIVGHRISIGDLAHNGLPAERTESKAWFDAVGPGWHMIMGNHDSYNDTDKATFAAAYDHDADWTLDLPCGVRLIGISEDDALNNDGTADYDATTRAWVQARAGEHAGPCVVFAHAPLYNSVLADPEYPDSKGSNTGGGPAEPVADISSMIRDTPNLVAWVSGHTHSPVSAPQLLYDWPALGGGSVVTINVSSIAYPAERPEYLEQPLYSPILTFAEDSVTVEFRDHRTGLLVPVGGQTSNTLTFKR